MSKQAYLISGYCEHTCSECGVTYTDNEYFRYYSLDKIMRYHINCKKCGAVFHEEPKRCYWDEWYSKPSCGCSERVKIDGLKFLPKDSNISNTEILNVVRW